MVLTDLPCDVLHAVPWEYEDLRSIVLTCHLFYDLFTPRLYETFDFFIHQFEAEENPRNWAPLFNFLESLSSRPQLAQYVHQMRVTLDLYPEHWNEQLVTRLISCYTLTAECDAPETLVTAYDGYNQAQKGKGEELDEEIDAQTRRLGHDRAVLARKHSVKDVVHGVGSLLCSKLTELRDIQVCYAPHCSLFDRNHTFQQLIELNIQSGDCDANEYGSGDNHFNDAAYLLSSPRLRKWSLSCGPVYHSNFGQGAPRSSNVQEMQLHCPNIPSEYLHRLLAIPMSLTSFRWLGKAWTCQVHEETHQCMTISDAETIACLRPFQESLTELAIQYEFVGTCPHHNEKCEGFHGFSRLSSVTLSPQVLLGFHTCSSRATCRTQCTHFRSPSEFATLLSPSFQQLQLLPYLNSHDLAAVIRSVVQDPSLSHLKSGELLSRICQFYTQFNYFPCKLR